jgi:DNA helicase II / ATP-dependent DNA helicase PcrA
VVGDEDQSIYAWRGARAGNLKRFTSDFPNAKLIRLEENYRSTQTILDAAAAVVKNNSDRLGKNLQATLGAGARLKFFEAPDSSAEAEFICGVLSELVRNDPDVRIAVLYRTGAQSRSFEEVLRRLGVRYRVVGGFSFYERAEVRNALAYVRLIFHPEDDVALLRVLNVPPRGIGAVTVAALEARAKETSSSLWAVISSGEFLTGKKFSGALRSFCKLIEDLQKDCQDMQPTQLIERVLGSTGYLDWVEQQDNLEHTSRAEDVLDQAALASDSDQYDDTIPVSLMTLHSAKGLEFDAVFLAGLEEGLLPHGRSLGSNAEVEEERRLFYVGMTRAKQSLVLSRAVYRRTYGEERLRAALPSRFLAEIPGDLIEAALGSQSEPGETRRYEPDPDYSENYAYRQKTRTPYGAASRGAARRASKDPLIGKRVRHAKYGVGTIIEVEGEGEDRKLTVSFQDHGAKKLIERYANLQLA